MNNKVIDASHFRSYLFDGMAIMFGGFMGVGTPKLLVDEIIKSGVSDLTLIGNDTGFVDTGVGPLIVSGQVKKLITSHIGTNPETGRRMLSGELDVELVPQGTLAERIRSGGAGLGGFLTPTGVGTIVEENKQKITINDITYLLELPIKADLAILQASIADTSGNLIYHLTARNFNPLIALAAKKVVAQCEQVIPVGQLAPECIVTPAALVDHLYLGEK
ncbi:acetate CoA-transferase subunit alpha [Pectobacterium wasabiae]|uniref:Acetyl-CoA:acetoacetyl-CoA transferase subunit alpha n=1 Tax=Pectobacterium wasabiae TaxID=55208 RepID=A0AAW3EJI1_9GAMM|nr:acetate CoA-transferase subunit alpha [Pectobacterium wasabiae]AOR64512.1 acetate CoA-transferase subunit alpha [Pectobacterium wasabiae CFBP 3304]EJS92612.1 Acetate CoA-transferase subunit alpha [Pectobacterium wasabiae CFBP 3304]KFX08995.1 acetyl-CoA:acetoacetyl-CoA transferase subunit alpha [Pectobacterium wasabiae]KGA29102.1 acetyl-CoA:acetoacetyl-CoA transferase subunit alpha [Pectobacterium wasabiae]